MSIMQLTQTIQILPTTATKVGNIRASPLYQD